MFKDKFIKIALGKINASKANLQVEDGYHDASRRISENEYQINQKVDSIEKELSADDFKTLQSSTWGAEHAIWDNQLDQDIKKFKDTLSDMRTKYANNGKVLTALNDLNSRFDEQPTVMASFRDFEKKFYDLHLNPHVGSSSSLRELHQAQAIYLMLERYSANQNINLKKCYEFNL